MARLRRKIGSAVLVSLGSLAAMRAGAQSSQIISFDDAMRIALEHSLTIRQAQVTAAIGEVDVSDARMQFVPNLTSDTTRSRSFGLSFSQTEGRVIDQTTNTVTLGVTSGVNLFNGFHDLAKVRSTGFVRDADNFDLKWTKETAVFTVASNYILLIERQDLLRIQRENLADEVKLEEQINQYVQAGARAVADLNEQQAEVAAARSAVLQAKSDVDSAEVELLRSLQLDPAGVYEFTPPRTESDYSVSPMLSELLNEAITKRSDLRADQARSEAADQDVWAAHSGYWPTLTLTAGYGSAYTDASPLSFNTQLGLQKGGSVTLDLSFPLFDRMQTRNASRRAYLQSVAAHITADGEREEVGLQVRQVFRDYQTARESLVAAQSQNEAAQRALETAQDRFTEGVGSLVELTQARSIFVQAERAIATARWTLAIQRILLDYNTGDLDIAKWSTN